MSLELELVGFLYVAKMSFCLMLMVNFLSLLALEKDGHSFFLSGWKSDYMLWVRNLRCNSSASHQVRKVLQPVGIAQGWIQGDLGFNFSDKEWWERDLV